MKKFLFAVLLFGLLGAAQAQNNAAGVALASAARTAAQYNSSDIVNTSYTGGHFIMNTSAFTSGTCTPKVQAKDPVSGTYYDLLVGIAVAATGIQVLKVYPGIIAVANASAADLLPQTFRVQVNCAGGPSMTFSVAYFLER